MNAEVVSIGDELTSGQRLDTNGQWLSQRLGEIGIRVLYHTTVGDDLGANVRVFREAVARTDLVISTGGLGPTADDLTRFAIAELAGADLEMREPVLQHIRRLFAVRKRPMPEANVVQAKFPKGSRVIDNPHGSAPGIDIQITRSDRSPARIIALPGVPAEMKEMWQQSLKPALAAASGHRQRLIRHRRVKCFGVGESDLEQMLPDLVRRGRSPTVGITVSQATITLRITADGETEQHCRQAMQPTLETIYQCLGDLVFGEEDDELQDVITRLLDQRQKTLATVEWGTGGLVSAWLSDASQSRSCYLGGIVLQSASSVANAIAGRPAATQSGQRVTQDMVRSAAVSCRNDFQSDFGLAIGPFPAADSSGSETDLVCCALAGPYATHHRAFPFAGHPQIQKARAAKQALNLLRLALLKTADVS